MTVAAYWCLSSNIGDNLTPWLIEKIREERPLWVQPTFDAEHYVVCGSILNWANEHAKVWGAGIATLTDSINPKATIYAVRGPLSRARALSCGAKCPAVYGDPALLLPRWIKPERKREGIGYVPHYVDEFRVSEMFRGERIISPLQSVEGFIDSICQCDKIVSSSLHGIIVAHAYGIPAAWAQWSDSIGGDGTKYRDYLLSVGLDVPYPVDMREGKVELHRDAYTLPGNIDTSMLWGMCPIRKSGE